MDMKAGVRFVVDASYKLTSLKMHHLLHFSI